MAASLKIGRFEVEVSGRSLFLSVPGLFQTFIHRDMVRPFCFDAWREDRSVTVRVGHIQAVANRWDGPAAMPLAA